MCEMDAMSELRKRCEYIIKQLEDYIFVVNGRAHINPEAISRIIEAFAKAEQIKGMEAARDLTHTHHAPFHWYFEWLRKKIDAEIKQLKEGG